MININLIPFKHTQTYAQNVEVSFLSSNRQWNEGEWVNLFCDIAGVCYF